jgi:Predicted metal-dependent hydrolase of the TIM-barrel fold
MYNYKIIDAHTHTYPEVIAEKAAKNLGEFYDFTVQCHGTYADLENQAKQTGTVGMFLLSVATSPKQVEKINTTVAENVTLSKLHGFETIGFAGMHQEYSNFGGELDRCLEMGLVGVKIHPDIQGVAIDEPALLPLYEKLEEQHMKLYFHMGDNRPQYRYSEPRRLAKILDLFPGLDVIAAHFGGYRAWDEAKNYIWGRPHVWYDASSALWDMTAERAKELILGCGVENVMYGTDYPVMRLDEYLELFMKIDLSETQRQAILYDNAKRFMSDCVSYC